MIPKHKPVKLAKPIRYLVSVVIRTWYDKVAGNSYYSGLIVVNHSFDTSVKIPFQYGELKNYDVLKLVVDSFNFGKVKTVDDLRKADYILVCTRYEETTKARCKDLVS